MKNHTKPSREELVALLQTRGWDLVTGSKATPVKGSTLEDAARAAHARHTKGEEPGLISKIESAIELDAVELQQLWEHLGLPM